MSVQMAPIGEARQVAEVVARPQTASVCGQYGTWRFCVPLFRALGETPQSFLTSFENYAYCVSTFVLISLEVSCYSS